MILYLKMNYLRFYFSIMIKTFIYCYIGVFLAIDPFIEKKFFFSSSIYFTGKAFKKYNNFLFKTFSI